MNRTTSVVELASVLRAYPGVRRWLNETIVHHTPDSRSLSELPFDRLRDCYPPWLLTSSRVAYVDEMPRPPFEHWNLHALDDFTFFNAAGLTLDHLILVRRGNENSESLLFHELVHAAQWRMLGRARFLAMYGIWQMQRGYDDNPLETMAFELQRRFDQRERSFEVVPVVQRRVQDLAASFQRESLHNRFIYCTVRVLG